MSLLENWKCIKCGYEAEINIPGGFGITEDDLIQNNMDGLAVSNNHTCPKCGKWGFYNIQWLDQLDRMKFKIVEIEDDKFGLTDEEIELLIGKNN